MTKMIPPIPTSAVMLPTPKQKIGFSIASIVGNDAHTVGGAAGGVCETVGDTNNSNKNINNNNNNNNNNNDNENNNNNNNNNNNHNKNTTNTQTGTGTNGPTSPPQTPPAILNMTQIPTLMTPTQAHQAHLHFTAAQQHAIQQHLIMQQQHQQQQHQQQQQQQHQQQQQQQHTQQQQQHQAAKSQDIQDLLQRLHNTAAAAAAFSPPPTQTRLSPCHDGSPTALQIKRSRSPLSESMENVQNPAQRLQPPHTPPKSVSPQSSTHATPPPHPPAQSTMPTMPAQFLPKPAAMLMPGLPPAGLVRPFPMGPGGPPPPPNLAPPTGPGGPQQGMPDIKALPPYINAPPELPPQHPNPHLFAAAQFQMAAALQAGHVLGAAGLPPHGSPFMPGPGMPRESYPLYPWLLSRHGRLFPHRFPGNFLLQPFRKPKRIRTAFSPSQLLKLEHAFESNQYVVGAERKALAQSLNLSETQVKVWFQNRRTKHKRMQQEDEKGGSGNSSSGERNSQNASFDEDDDELIDMEMDDCPSDEEHELDASH